MIISRKLAHKVQNRLQVILSLIETGKTTEAVETIRELATFLSSHLETAEEERARRKREDEPHA